MCEIATMSDKGASRLTVSDTAYAIAHMRALEMERPAGERLFEDPYARIFASAGEHAREGIARFMIMLDGIRLRVRHIDDIVNASIQAGTRQLLILGAGFDTRGMRLASVRENAVCTFEVDLPIVLETKRRLLEEAGVRIPDSLRSIATDFQGDFEAPLRGALTESGYRPSEPVVIVWEGVTPYIGVPAIDRTLRFAASIAPPSSQIIFDYSDLLFEPVLGPERTRRAGFTGFEEVTIAEVWTRHLSTEPAMGMEIGKVGVATK